MLSLPPGRIHLGMNLSPNVLKRNLNTMIVIFMIMIIYTFRLPHTESITQPDRPMHGDKYIFSIVTNMPTRGIFKLLTISNTAYGATIPSLVDS